MSCHGLMVLFRSGKFAMGNSETNLFEASFDISNQLLRKLEIYRLQIRDTY